MGQRIRTALIAIPIALALIKLGGLPFAAGVLLLGLVAWLEYKHMLKKIGYVLYEKFAVLSIICQIVAAAFGRADLLTPIITISVLFVLLNGLYHYARGKWAENSALSCLAIVYIGLPFSHVIMMRELTGAVYQVPIWGTMSLGEALLWTVMFGTWASDTFAYFGGRLMGKHPLAPAISPHKTLEGAVWGFIGSVVMIMLMGTCWLRFPVLEVFILSLVVAIFAPLGDLVESILKRNCEIKDSGNFFPGHGGVLDRCDSLIFSVPLAYYFITFVMLH
ncbi:MAG: phosphatidate cytidylyltransferase [Acidaminococcus sp.]|jgi:phosphatidate cytidylyltransferase|nr:phosphatidate cytidylyltransferase [Acidaminococcus sp.]MCI2099994.1 phosphatidate cytidylyltransferase [Acidaminococcus sp.]MCI2114270.1 phosphatidate cytidylyltransferase [Acidaminococcus sp.]MCI2116216.1 phosphatidate cytidylyltransferase [Acidaminococcus sp.]